MTLIKVQHDKNNPYVVVNKSILAQNKLSSEAKVIFFYAFSRPDDWVFYKKEIYKHMKEGRDQITRALGELQEFGYLHKRAKKEGNRLNGWDWFFFETPKTKEELKIMFQKDWDSDVLESSQSQTQTLLSNDSLQSKENNNESVVVPFSKEVSDLLDQIPFNKNFRSKVHLMLDKDKKPVTEHLIKHAANITMNSTWDSPEAFFTSVINDPKRYKMPAAPGQKEENDKELVKEILSKIKSKPEGIVVEVLNTVVEIGNGINQRTVIKYGERGFLQKLHEGLKKWRIELR